MTLYLHIGAQKTGSTTIQEALYNNREVLQAAGLEYPEVEPDDTNKVSHYNSFRGFFTRQKDQIASTERFLERINQIDGDVLLSSEVLSNWPLINDKEEAAEYWLRKQLVLERLRERLAQKDVKIIYCVRSRASYLKSLFKQHLKVQTRPSLSLEIELRGFLKREIVRSDAKRQVKVWEKVFGDVRVIDFDKHARAGNLLEAFTQTLDHDITLPDAPVRNVSPDWTDLEARRVQLSFGYPQLGEADPALREKFNEATEEMVRRTIARAIDNN